MRSHFLDLYLCDIKKNNYAYNISNIRFAILLAKIALEPEIKLVENNGIKPKDIKRAMSIVEQYREEFIEKWIEFHGE